MSTFAVRNWHLKITIIIHAVSVEKFMQTGSRAYLKRIFVDIDEFKRLVRCLTDKIAQIDTPLRSVQNFNLIIVLSC